MGVVESLEANSFYALAALIEFIILVLIGLHVPPVMVWLERRAPALMQRRKGPNRVGFFGIRLWGLIQSLADAIKLIFKEESVPAAAEKAVFHLAPIFGLFPAFLILGALPFGLPLELFGHSVPLQVINLNVGLLFILAMSGVTIYGIVLGGWASRSKYTLMGSLRASAQMVSYEIPLGLSLVPIVLLYDSLDLAQIATAQSSAIWKWGVVLSPLSFITFLICMFAETNRAPFDLAEGESELVAGFHTEFGSAKFALIFLSEYVNMFALSCLCSVLFFGGWNIPFVSFEFLKSLIGHNPAVLLGVLCLFLKAGFFMWLYVWVRWTVPRFRYDQLMNLGWKFLIPLNLFNVIATAAVLTFLI